MISVNQQLEQAQALFKAGRLDEARGIFADIHARIPDHGVALQGLAYVAAKQSAYDEAIQYLVQAEKVLPQTVELYVHLTYLCKLAKRYEEALAWINHALALEPGDYEALTFKVGILIDLKRHDQALANLRDLVKIFPMHPELHFQIGQVCAVLGIIDDEIAAYQRALELKPDLLPARVNLGVVLRDRFRFDEALDQFNQVLKIDTNHPGARTNRAQLNLLLGRLSPGWKDYEWRWQDGALSHGVQGPRWQAPKSTKAAKGCRLLVHAEQGFGDTIQFSRYVSFIKNLFPKTEMIFRVQPELVSLLQLSFPNAIVGSSADPLPDFDFHLPLMSAPFALEKYVQSPPKLDHFLKVQNEKAEQWQHLLGSKTKPRIGLVWSGRVTHLNDHNRSITLKDMVKLLSERYDFYSLQKEIRSDDQAVLNTVGQIHSFSQNIADFSDTAALCQQMDLVISVDTSVAHLSASLGLPTWVLLPNLPDWRWQLNRTDSDWYETVRLFRQGESGDWAEVLHQVSQEMDSQLA
ncbi:tetratricopeptide repeat protein [Zwartia sp.]|uniref:tetratricopeptide repeat protein n=1 Tax=Zwartia sp. TaxID=2978004 RepID=UPI00271A6254|nr:tetratricopeptide repeat protein [Zwartia sp.]MDO9025248.1 tetratricopeptide repeat protein [Zwartia sp.]